MLVGTGTCPVRLSTVQPEGKRPMPAGDWARGARLGPDARLGDDPVGASTDTTTEEDRHV